MRKILLKILEIVIVSETTGFGCIFLCCRYKLYQIFSTRIRTSSPHEGGHAKLLTVLLWVRVSSQWKLPGLVFVTICMCYMYSYCRPRVRRVYTQFTVHVCCPHGRGRGHSPDFLSLSGARASYFEKIMGGETPRLDSNKVQCILELEHFGLF